MYFSNIYFHRNEKMAIKDFTVLCNILTEING